MKIHFIGIGGIGVSALANYYLTKGFEVSGSDLAEVSQSSAIENSVFLTTDPKLEIPGP